MKNKVHLTGVISDNLKIYEYIKGKKRAFFSILVSDYFKSDTGKTIHVRSRFTVTAWDKIARQMENTVMVNQEVIIEGRLINNNYRSKSGEMIFSNEIVMSKIAIAESKQKNKEVKT